MESSRTELEDGIIDVTSFLALDVAKTKVVVVIVALAWPSVTSCSLLVVTAVVVVILDFWQFLVFLLPPSSFVMRKVV